MLLQFSIEEVANMSQRLMVVGTWNPQTGNWDWNTGDPNAVPTAAQMAALPTAVPQTAAHAAVPITAQAQAAIQGTISNAEAERCSRRIVKKLRYTFNTQWTSEAALLPRHERRTNVCGVRTRPFWGDTALSDDCRRS